MICDEKVRFTFRLPVPLFTKVKDVARHEGVSVNAVMLKILWQYFENKSEMQNQMTGS